MRKLFFIFASTLLLASTLPAQEMPESLKADLKAQSTKLHPDNESAAKSWYRTQRAAWESIQNMSFSIDEADLKEIKANAEKKYPLDFSKQETYMTDSAQRILDCADFKSQLGAEAFSALKSAITKDGDYSKLYDSMAEQVAAKAKIDALKTDKIDEVTLTITKEVIAKKFPNNYPAQYDALRKQLKLDAPAETKTEAASNADSTAPSGGDAVAATDAGEEKSEESAEPERPLTMGELNKKAREIFNKQSFTVEGDKTCTAVGMEIAGKQILLLPFASYSPGNDMTIVNNLGETVEYNKEEIFASKSIPLMIIFPKSMPEGFTNAKTLTDKEYRDILNKNIFFVGTQRSNVITFPVRLTAISNKYLTLSTKVPSNFNEGTMLIDPTSGATVGLLIGARGNMPEIDWSKRSDINRLERFLERPIYDLSCVRINKLGDLEKIDPEKFEAQRKKVDSIKALNEDFMFFFSNTRMQDSVNRQIIGSVIRKHIDGFKRRMEISRFERMYRAFIQDMLVLIKAEMKDVNLDEFYSIFRDEAEQYIKILQSANKVFQDALKGSGAYKNILHNDIKRAQNME